MVYIVQATISNKPLSTETKKKWLMITTDHNPRFGVLNAASHKNVLDIGQKNLHVELGQEVAS